MAIRTVTRAGVGLVVGIIILGLLVLGGLWLVRERGEQAQRAEAISIADRQLEAESDKDVVLNTDEDTKEETETPAKPEEPAETTPADRPSTTVKPEAAEELPQTGPEAASIAVFGILSFAVMSFIRSRKLVSDQQ